MIGQRTRPVGLASRDQSRRNRVGRPDEREAEAIEALRGQRREVCRPHLAVVEPRLVFDFAGEQPHNAADSVGRTLGHRPGHGQTRQRVVGVAHASKQRAIDRPERALKKARSVALVEVGRAVVLCFAAREHRRRDERRIPTLALQVQEALGSSPFDDADPSEQSD